MGIAATSLTELAAVVSRGLRGMSRAGDPNDGLDPYEPVPLKREEMASLFELRTGAPFEVAEKLRESERREHDTLMTIRSALYAD